MNSTGSPPAPCHIMTRYCFMIHESSEVEIREPADAQLNFMEDNEVDTKQMLFSPCICWKAGKDKVKHPLEVGSE